MISDIIISIITQGLIYGFIAFGLLITYKILDFPDLTVDGSFPLGAAVTAVFIIKGTNPVLCILGETIWNMYGERWQVLQPVLYM